MGQSSAETVREIEDLRDRIETNVRELEQRLPQPAIWAKRLVGIAVGGGISAIVLRSVLKKGGKAAKSRLPGRGGGGEGNGASKALMIGLTAAVVGLGVIQFRQLQKLNRSVAAPRI